MAKKQMTLAQLRNLPQYKGFSDEMLELKRREIIDGDTTDKVERMLEAFEKDYDLSGMAANDLVALRNLAQQYVYMKEINKRIEVSLLDSDTATDLERLIRIAGNVQKLITDIQTNLAITRKQRKVDKEQDIVTAWDDLKQRAKRFLSERLSYIYCPECRMLLANVWFLYPDEEKNVLRLRCNRIIDDTSGKICNNEFTVTSRELVKLEGRNITGVLPT